MPSLRSFARAAGTLVGGLLVVSFIAGVAFSRYYWGYWFTPPSIGPTVRRFAELQSFVKIDAERPSSVLAWRFSSLPAGEIDKGASWHHRSSIHFFWFRLHEALWEARVPAVPEKTPPENLLRAIEKHVALSEVLVDGHPGSPLAKRLNGYAAIGRAHSGELLVVLALNGGEMSNDHYPVFDFAYACDTAGDPCHLIKENVYFEDVAGFEGFRWYRASLLAFFLGIGLAGVVFVLWGAAIASRRLFKKPKPRAA
jgi:hypothetical protein